MKKLKVVMICHFSNENVRKYIGEKTGIIESIFRKISKKSLKAYDFAQWNTNAIKEYEKLNNEIELHVISPAYIMRDKESVFVEKGIYYYFFKDEQTFFTKCKNKITGSQCKEFKKNREYISRTISKIQPDVVYIIGAENPNYALAALDVPQSIPVVVQLQTLMNDPDFEKHCTSNRGKYLYRSTIEKKVINRADYIGISVPKIIDLVKKIKPNAIFFKTRLAIGVNIFEGNFQKYYDFVYFANDISKGFDLALEAFAIARKKFPNLTLLVIGNYDIEYKRRIDLRIKQLSVEDYITFTGRLASHEEVLNKIREAKYALIPLKIDIISSTIREALANGLPVITTITNGGTPQLNEIRKTALLSPIGDHQALADNMIRLLSNSELASELRKNGFLFIQENYSNKILVQQQKSALIAAVENFNNGIPIPETLL